MNIRQNDFGTGDCTRRELFFFFFFFPPDGNIIDDPSRRPRCRPRRRATLDIFSLFFFFISLLFRDGVVTRLLADEYRGSVSDEFYEDELVGRRFVRPRNYIATVYKAKG